MLKKILAVIAGLIVVILGAAAMQPADFKISRSAMIAATPVDIFAQINDFHNWNNWSPWAKLDPQMKTTFEGPASGEGAVYSWAGNSEVGEGKMTILKSKEPAVILVQLDFLKPMAATHLADFTLKPEGTGTMVTWTMTGKNGFVSKLICLFMDMDKLVGPSFEKGLAQLKTVVETQKSNTL